MKLSQIPDPIREAAGLPLGPDGAYFSADDPADAVNIARLLGKPMGSWTELIMRNRSKLMGKTGEPDNFWLARWESVVQPIRVAAGQPNSSCQWVPGTDGRYIVWKDGDKFYNYIEWLHYIIDNFLSVWDYEISGKVLWEGDEPFDRGIIHVDENNVKILKYELDNDIGDISTEIRRNGFFVEDKVLVILNALSNSEAGVRYDALRVLCDMKPLGSVIIPFVIGLMNDVDWRIRTFACHTLKKEKEVAVEALSAIIQLLKDENEYVRNAAQEAISEINQMK